MLTYSCFSAWGMFEEYLKECFLFNMFGLHIWRRYRASPMQVYPKGDGADWAGDGYADQETDVTVSIQCFIQVVCNYSFHSMFHSRKCIEMRCFSAWLKIFATDFLLSKIFWSWVLQALCSYSVLVSCFDNSILNSVVAMYNFGRLAFSKTNFEDK